MAQHYKHTLAYPQLPYSFCRQSYLRKKICNPDETQLPAYSCLHLSSWTWLKKITEACCLVLLAIYDHKYEVGPQYCKGVLCFPSQLNLLFSHCHFHLFSSILKSWASLHWSSQCSPREQSSYWPKSIMNLLFISIRKQTQRLLHWKRLLHSPIKSTSLPPTEAVLHVPSSYNGWTVCICLTTTHLCVHSTTSSLPEYPITEIISSPSCII